jgi:hypothetical protein
MERMQKNYDNILKANTSSTAKENGMVNAF